MKNYSKAARPRSMIAEERKTEKLPPNRSANFQKRCMCNIKGWSYKIIFIKQRNIQKPQEKIYSMVDLKLP